MVVYLGAIGPVYRMINRIRSRGLQQRCRINRANPKKAEGEQAYGCYFTDEFPFPRGNTRFA